MGLAKLEISDVLQIDSIEGELSLQKIYDRAQLKGFEEEFESEEN